MTFSENLKGYMTERHETAYQLAKMLKVSQSTVSCWLSGKSYPQLRHVAAIADHYGRDFAEVAGLPLREEGDAN